MSPDRIFVNFLNAIDELLWRDWSDVADGYAYHDEWTAQKCWERMHETYKQQILSAIPNIEEYLRWGMNQDNAGPFYDFIQNVFNRIVHFEKAEIIKRAQTKMLKEEIAMKVMHPDRIEQMTEQYGVDVLEFY
jgi:hypothetical protein